MVHTIYHIFIPVIYILLVIYTVIQLVMLYMLHRNLYISFCIHVYLWNKKWSQKKKNILNDIFLIQCISFPFPAPREKVPWWTSWRLCLAIIGFLGFVHIYAQRVGMSVAIVCMVNQTAVRMLRSEIEVDLNVSRNGGANLPLVASNGNVSHNDVNSEQTCAMQYLQGEEKFKVNRMSHN